MKPSETAMEVGRAIYAMVEAGETISAAVIAVTIDAAYKGLREAANLCLDGAQYGRLRLDEALRRATPRGDDHGK